MGRRGEGGLRCLAFCMEAIVYQKGTDRPGTPHPFPTTLHNAHTHHHARQYKWSVGEGRRHDFRFLLLTLFPTLGRRYRTLLGLRGEGGAYLLDDVSACRARVFVV